VENAEKKLKLKNSACFAVSAVKKSGIEDAGPKIKNFNWRGNQQ